MHKRGLEISNGNEIHRTDFLFFFLFLAVFYYRLSGCYVRILGVCVVRSYFKGRTKVMHTYIRKGARDGLRQRGYTLSCPW